MVYFFPSILFSLLLESLSFTVAHKGYTLILFLQKFSYDNLNHYSNLALVIINAFQ